MGWYGKLIGAVLGAIIGRGWLGAIVGFLIGHQFDRRSAGLRPRGGVPPRDLQVVFFRTTFQVMGHVAKADGRVTEQEIGAARETMRRFALGEADVRRAIELKRDCDGAYNILARSLFESDRWAEALESISQALAVNGDDYNVYVPYTNMYEGLGRTEDAAKLREREIATGEDAA